MIVGEHRVDFFAGEEGGFPVGKPFGGARETTADAPDSLELLLAVGQIVSLRHLRTLEV
jgi:hypothetical protein